MIFSSGEELGGVYVFVYVCVLMPVLSCLRTKVSIRNDDGLVRWKWRQIAIRVWEGDFLAYFASV